MHDGHDFIMETTYMHNRYDPSLRHTRFLNLQEYVTDLSHISYLKLACIRYTCTRI